MNFNKYFAFLALLVLCVLGYQTAEAHHHHHSFLGHVGHEVDKGVKKVQQVAKHVATAKKVIEVGGAVAGAIAA